MFLDNRIAQKRREVDVFVTLGNVLLCEAARSKQSWEEYRALFTPRDGPLAVKESKRRGAHLDRHNGFIVQTMLMKVRAEDELDRLLKWQSRLNSIIPQPFRR